MKILFYSTKDFEKPYLLSASNNMQQLEFIPEALSLQTAGRAKGFEVVSIFTGDDAAADVLKALQKNGVRCIAIRAAGYDNVDLEMANELSIRVANVPEYSPFAVAEHAVALLQALNRKIITADTQVHGKNFTLGNLVGFDLHGKTVGIIGTGRIGSVFAKIMHGFGCRILGYDIVENKMLTEAYGLEYVDLPALCREAHIISMHTALTPGTKHMIDKKLIGLMQQGTMLINTSRGACVDTAAVIEGLQTGHIGYYGADVYENERGIFFYDYSNKELNDAMLKKLLAMPNVLLTPHQAFATEEALINIAGTTFYNIDCWHKKMHSKNELTAALNTTPSYIDDEEL
jgi:D-lactate dehydrogenase